MTSRAAGAISLLMIFAAGCGGEAAPQKNIRELRVFHAAGMTPVLDAVRDDVLRELGIKLLNEPYGSQVACRQITELGRTCDLLMLADPHFVTELLAGYSSWRMDYARDEMVIAIGSRAPDPSGAEADWHSALSKRGVRIGRVHEDLGPAGYRTLLTWKLQEMLSGDSALTEKLLKNTVAVVDDVNQLTPLLKIGDIDFAFIYRSTCVAHDIRHIELEEKINLGSADADYSAASVTYKKLSAGRQEDVTARGEPITWTLTVPDRNADAGTAREFIHYLISRRKDLLERHGFRIMKPKFYGTPNEYDAFKDIAENSGALK